MTEHNDKQPLSLRMSRSVQQTYTPDQVKWHYEHGLVLQSIYAVAKRYGCPDLTDWVRRMYDTKITADGGILTYKEQEFNLDQIRPGVQLFDLDADTHAPQYRKAIETLREQLRGHPRTQSGGFWHKKIYPWQMWLDGLFMAEPFYARYVAEFGPESDYEDIVHQFELMYAHARDERTGLLYHAWDESCKQLWADVETGRAPHVWGRAMGWFCMALLDVLDWIPDTDACRPWRNRLTVIADSLVQPLLTFQDKGQGLWYQVVDMGTKPGNYLETSASAMFVYFLFKLVRLHLLSPAAGKTEAEALAAARKGYEGLCSRLSEEAGILHLSGICKVAGLGGTPYRDGSYQYYVGEPVVSDDFKGVGPFIFASLESEAASEAADH